MFFFRKVVTLFLIGFLVLAAWGSLSRGADGRYEAAYRQGFVDGQQVAGGAEGAKTVPDTAQGTNVYIRDHGFFFPGPGVLLLCLVPLFALGLLFMGAGRRKRHGRSWAGHPCGGGHPPWKQGSWTGTPSEKSPDDIDDGPAEPVKQA